MSVLEREKEKKSVPLWAVAVGIIALLAFVIWWGAKSFGPTEYAKTPQQVARESEWDALVKKAGGDMTKLTPDEAQKYYAQTGPGARSIWESYAKKNGFRK